ncbi:uncharacterized protein LOC143929847 [Lithobates pipiens]
MTNWRHVDINNLVSIGSLDHFKMTAEHFKHDGIPSLVLQHLWMMAGWATLLGSGKTGVGDCCCLQLLLLYLECSFASKAEVNFNHPRDLILSLNLISSFFV